MKIYNSKNNEFQYIRYTEITNLDMQLKLSKFVEFRNRPLPCVDGNYIEDAVFLEDYAIFLESYTNANL